MLFKRKPKKEPTEEQQLATEWLKQVWLPTHGTFPRRGASHYEEAVRSGAAWLQGNHDLSRRIASYET